MDKNISYIPIEISLAGTGHLQTSLAAELRQLHELFKKNKCLPPGPISTGKGKVGWKNSLR